MNQTKQEVQQCPFCPLWGNPDIEQHVIGSDFFGAPAKVAGIACCGDCAEGLVQLSEVDRAWYVQEARQAIHDRGKAAAIETFRKEREAARNEEEWLQADARYDATCERLYQVLKVLKGQEVTK